jgi:hypothetical protein
VADTECNGAFAIAFHAFEMLPAAHKFQDFVGKRPRAARQ